MMRNLATLGLILLASLGMAEQVPSPPETWTMGNATQYCLDELCWYGFAINFAPETQAKCTFTISKRCVEATSTVQCDGLRGYSIDASIVDGRFIVLETSFWQPHLQKVKLGRLSVGGSIARTKRAATIVARDDEAAIDETPSDEAAIDEAPTWTLENVFRETPSDRRIWFGFHITSDGFDPKWCYMLVHVDEGDSRKASFTGQQCVGSNFTVSWGYREEEDAGILTLFNPDRTRKAWFGWNNVNNATDLPDAGPSATIPVED